MTKKLQRNRVILDFINACDELILDEDLDDITLRKVAKKLVIIVLHFIITLKT